MFYLETFVCSNSHREGMMDSLLKYPLIRKSLLCFLHQLVILLLILVIVIMSYSTDLRENMKHRLKRTCKNAF